MLGPAARRREGIGIAEKSPESRGHSLDVAGCHDGARAEATDDLAEPAYVVDDRGYAGSEDLYGDYQLVVDAVGEGLYATRETYAASLEGRAADEYRAAFDRKAGKRFGRYASFLQEEQ